jgi:hypothetical protein
MGRFHGTTHSRQLAGPGQVLTATVACHTRGVIPTELDWLFWDVDPRTIEIDRHRDYVLERIMTRGNWLAMRWLIDHVDQADLAEFLHRRGERLTPRDRAFWSLVAGVPFRAAPGGGRPAWAG